MPSARDLAADAETLAELPPGPTERFLGYALMSLPFASGHVLGLRRFPVTSVGPGYTSVWVRTPDDAWRIYTTIDPSLSCPRYFGGALETTSVHTIVIDWADDHRLSVRIDDDIDLRWDIALAATPMSRMMSAMSGAVPRAAWQSDRFLSMLGRTAGPALGAGRIGMTGGTPNGQRFRAKLDRMWMVDSSLASMHGESLGAVAPLADQTRLGDFWMPQRGIFMIGGAEFDPREAGEHPATTRSAS